MKARQAQDFVAQAASLAKQQNVSVVLCGDFNATPTNSVYKYICVPLKLIPVVPFRMQDIQLCLIRLFWG